ncbi:MAG: CO dehydrogenase/acetyl-CoA synthase subunit delta [Methanoregula sp.]
MPEENHPKGNKHILRESLPRLLGLLDGVEKIELEQVALEIGDLEFFIPTGTGPAGSISGPYPPAVTVPVKPTALIPAAFTPYREEFSGRIREVMLGATRAKGGSRSRVLTIGGADAPPFAFPENPPLHPPVLAVDVFYIDISLPRAIKASLKEVMADPAEWARLNVNKFGADMVTVHLMSTDPLIKDASPREAARTVEEVLQAVDVPIIIGGCGDPHKDSRVFCEIAEMAHGERLLLNSVTLDMAEAKTLEPVAKAARKHNHAVLAFTGLELNKAKELNRRLYEYLPPESIVMDLTTVALGYGLEYSFTIHERARYAALRGDTELQHPTISASTNAWAAREAWMKMDARFGARDIRGPLWETLNALTLLLAGVDILMMMHPAAIRTVRETVSSLMKHEPVNADRIADWAGARI